MKHKKTEEADEAQENSTMRMVSGENSRRSMTSTSLKYQDGDHQHFIVVFANIGMDKEAEEVCPLLVQMLKFSLHELTNM